MTLHLQQDNILIRLEPRPETALPGGVIVHPGFEYKSGRGTEAKASRDPRAKATGVRWGVVVAVGPGHVPGCRRCGGEKHGQFLPTTLRPGDRVCIGEQSGQDYSLDMKGLRQRDKTETVDLGDAEGRLVREDEVMLIDESGA